MSCVSWGYDPPKPASYWRKLKRQEEREDPQGAIRDLKQRNKQLEKELERLKGDLKKVIKRNRI